MHMNGFTPFQNYPFDPWMMFMMMDQNRKREEDLKDEDVIKRYNALKEAFTPPKKDEPKKNEDKLTTGDYFIMYTFMFLTGSIIATWMFMSKFITLVEVLHK